MPNRGMRILLTGSHGFVGDAVRRQLKADGREVVALDRDEPPLGEAT